MHPACRMRIDVDQFPPEHLAGSPPGGPPRPGSPTKRRSRVRSGWVMTENDEMAACCAHDQRYRCISLCGAAFTWVERKCSG